MELVGFEVEPRTVRRGSIVDITYRWRILRAAPQTVVTRLDGVGGWSELHEPGFGNLRRLVAEGSLSHGAVLKEAYPLLVPSGTEVGRHRLRVGVLTGEPRAMGPDAQVVYADLGTLEVTP
jgi:hypothetical protein